jgi:L-ascorbate metabolism protein UlaG (beta-lactamase superfamily)
VKYRNLEEPHSPRGLRDVFRWQVADRFRGRRREAPRRYYTPRTAPDLALIASAAPSLTWVGHASWLVRLGGRSVVIDPIWSDKIGPLRRNAPPGIPLDEAAPDVVLVTHNHRDHLDAPTLKRIVHLGRPVRFVVPAGLGKLVRELGGETVDELEWWQALRVPAEGVGGELVVTLVPSQHWSRRGLGDLNETLWGGYVVEGGGRRVYHAGDTAYFSGFREIGRRFPSLDAALLPIGAYDPEWFMRTQHVDPDDAMRAFLDLGARLFCAMHWGTFKLTDEPIDEPPMLLERAREREGVPRERVWVPALGETRAL